MSHFRTNHTVQIEVSNKDIHFLLHYLLLQLEYYNLDLLRQLEYNNLDLLPQLECYNLDLLPQLEYYNLVKIISLIAPIFWYVQL